MAEDKAQFTLLLEDKTSGAAERASDALAKLQQGIKRDTKALADMQSAMKRLKAGTNVNADALKELQAKIDKTKNSISDAQGKAIQLGGRFNLAERKAKSFAERMKDAADKAGKLPGPIGQAGGSLSVLMGKMSGGTMVALGLAAALVAVGVAALGAVGSIARFGVESGNARRSQELHFEAISRMRRGLVGMRAGAGEVMTAIDQVAGSTATSREQVARFAEILQRGGVRGANLTTALRAASTKAAALGDESGEAFARMAVGASRAGTSINRLADDVQARFGGVAARRMLDMNVMSTKLRENFAGLFDGLNLEPLLGMFHEVVGFFSQSTATGRALKAIVTALFQPMIDSAGEGTPIVKRFFQGIVIAALRTTIALLTVKRWFNETFSGTAVGRVDKLKVALYAGMVAFGMIALAAGAAALFIGAMVFAIAAPFLILGYAIARVMDTIEIVQATFRDFGIQWREGGSQMVDGFIAGIRGGIDRAKRAVTDLGRSAIESLRSVLDIHSPSRVFAELGSQIPAGIAVGVDSGAEGANAAVGGMVEVPAALGVPGGRGAVSISIGDIHVNGGNSAEIAANLRDEVARVFEGLALTMGGSRA